MKLSDKTMMLLKNIAAVNNTVILKTGKKQIAPSPSAGMIIEVELDQEFPVDFGVYNLSQLLSVLSMMPEAEISFEDNTMLITSNGYKVTYKECAKELISELSEEAMAELDKMPIKTEFDLSQETLTKMLKLAVLNELTHVAFVDKYSGIFMEAFNKDVADTNKASFTVVDRQCVSEQDTLNSKFIVSAQNLKLVPDNYKVQITESGYAKFMSQTHKLRYLVATEVGK